MHKTVGGVFNSITGGPEDAEVVGGGFGEDGVVEEDGGGILDVVAPAVVTGILAVGLSVVFANQVRSS